MIAPIPPTPPTPPGAGATSATSGSGGGGFGNVLKDALSGLNSLEQGANAATQAMASGQSQDVATAMVAIEKANLGLQLAVEARNQALSAYQQMMQMPL